MKKLVFILAFVPCIAFSQIVTKKGETIEDPFSYYGGTLVYKQSGQYRSIMFQDLTDESVNLTRVIVRNERNWLNAGRYFRNTSTFIIVGIATNIASVVLANTLKDKYKPYVAYGAVGITTAVGIGAIVNFRKGAIYLEIKQ
jgi:hypothetical protein